MSMTAAARNEIATVNINCLSSGKGLEKLEQMDWEDDSAQLMQSFKSGHWESEAAAQWHIMALELCDTRQKWDFAMDFYHNKYSSQMVDMTKGKKWKLNPASIPDADADRHALQEALSRAFAGQQVSSLAHSPASILLAIEEGCWPEMKSNGKPLATIENLRHMLGYYGIRPRYNLITKRDEAQIPGLEATRDNHDEVVLSTVTSACERNGYPVGHVPQYMAAISDANAFNPILTWIESREWDGSDHLGELFDTLVLPVDYDFELAEILIKRWMLSAVAAIAKPEGFHSRGVLVFTGGQGIGKTSWFRSLLPIELRQYFREGGILDPADKDSVTGAVSNWLVELGELDATFKKADIARLKAFITSTEDRLRKPYARTESTMPRRTVFCASVNDSQFLTDTTGNSRFWTVEVHGLAYNRMDAGTVNMQQVWAQVLEMYRDGEQWWLTAEEEQLLTASNERYEMADPIEQSLLDTYNVDVIGNERKTATEVLRIIGIDKPSKSQTNHMGNILRKYCGEPKKSGSRRVYCLPLRRI